MQGPAESWQDYTLFGFLVGGVLVAVLAELRKLKTPLDFGVLLRVVVHLFAFSALEFYQCFLGHKIFVEPAARVELATCSLQNCCSNQLSYAGMDGPPVRTGQECQRLP